MTQQRKNYVIRLEKNANEVTDAKIVRKRTAETPAPFAPGANVNDFGLGQEGK